VQNNGNNMILVPQHVAMQYPTRTFCPATGGSHVPHKSFGAIGIIIGIVFFPIGLLA
jgi:hypothetical protein